MDKFTERQTELLLYLNDDKVIPSSQIKVIGEIFDIGYKEREAEWQIIEVDSLNKKAPQTVIETKRVLTRPNIKMYENTSFKKQIGTLEEDDYSRLLEIYTDHLERELSIITNGHKATYYLGDNAEPQLFPIRFITWLTAKYEYYTTSNTFLSKTGSEYDCYNEDVIKHYKATGITTQEIYQRWLAKNSNSINNNPIRPTISEYIKNLEEEDNKYRPEENYFTILLHIYTDQLERDFSILSANRKIAGLLKGRRDLQLFTLDFVYWVASNYSCNRAANRFKSIKNRNRHPSTEGYRHELFTEEGKGMQEVYNKWLLKDEPGNETTLNIIEEVELKEVTK